MAVIAALTIMALALAAQKAPQLSELDRMPAGEIACGVDGHKRSAPCRCMEVRRKAQDEAIAACALKSDPAEWRECRSQVPACHDVHVVNVEEAAQRYRSYHGDWKKLPPVCSQSCKKSKCYCCKT